MKSIVGYSKSTMNSFAVEVDMIHEVKDMSRIQIISSFYKIMIGDIDDLDTYSSEVVSVLLLLNLIYKSKQKSRNRASFQDTTKDIVFSAMNRGLYEQGSKASILRASNLEPAIMNMSMRSIADSKFEEVVCHLMIRNGKDLEEMLVSARKLKNIMLENRLNKKTFIDLEDIKNATDKYRG